MVLERLPKQLGVLRRLTNSIWVHARQNVEAVSGLVVLALLGMSCRVLQHTHDFLLLNLLDALSVRQRFRQKILAVITNQNIRIRKKPTFHALNHQVTGVVRYVGRPLPAITPMKVLPSPGGGPNGPLGIDKKQADTIWTSVKRPPEILVGGSASAGCNHLRERAATWQHFLEKAREGVPAF